MKERRIRRSNDTCEAARLYLETVAKDLGLTALAIANEDGLLISGSLGPGSGIVDLDAIAAISPLLANKVLSADACRDLTPRGKALKTIQLSLSSGTVFLTTVGGRAPASRDARAALDRILAA